MIKDEFEKIIAALSLEQQSALAVEISRSRSYLDSRTTHTIEQSDSTNHQSLLNFKEFQINQLINSAPAAISFIDLEYTYIFTNKVYKNWFGKNLDGSKVYDFVGIDHFNKFGKKNLSSAFSGKAIVKELELKTNGKVFQLMVTYAPAQDVDQRIIGAYVFAVEISSLKEIQSRLELKNQELQRYIDSYLQLENFAHIASHDLKAPLKNIISFGKLLEEHASNKLDAQELKFLDFIQSSAENMNNTIKGLLDFSLLSNQKPVFLKVVPVELIKTLIFDLETSLSQKNAKINIEHLPPLITVDPILFRQLFQNLILNGIKFCDDEEPKITITSKETEKEFWFYVKDNGIGIKQEYLHKIFAVFAKLHGHEEYEGTGIGLALSKKIAKHHEGDLFVKSSEGNGSTFYFSISKDIKETETKHLMVN